MNANEREWARMILELQRREDAGIRIFFTEGNEVNKGATRCGLALPLEFFGKRFENVGLEQNGANSAVAWPHGIRSADMLSAG